jgi:hypothetical protein
MLWKTFCFHFLLICGYVLSPNYLAFLTLVGAFSDFTLAELYMWKITPPFLGGTGV